MRDPYEIQDMTRRLDDNIREHGWDASVDAAQRALEWAMGATWPRIESYMERPDDERRREWIARGGDPKDWPVELS